MFLMFFGSGLEVFPPVPKKGHGKVAVTGTFYKCIAACLKGISAGCVPLPERTGMDIITEMDYRNGLCYSFGCFKCILFA